MVPKPDASPLDGDGEMRQWKGGCGERGEVSESWMEGKDHLAVVVAAGRGSPCDEKVPSE